MKTPTEPTSQSLDRHRQDCYQQISATARSRLSSALRPRRREDALRRILRARSRNGNLIGLPGASQTLNRPEDDSFEGFDLQAPNFFESFSTDDRYDEGHAEVQDISHPNANIICQDISQETSPTTYAFIDEWNSQSATVDPTQTLVSYECQQQYLRPDMLNYEIDYNQNKQDPSVTYYNSSLSMQDTTLAALPTNIINQHPAIQAPYQVSEFFYDSYPDPSNLLANHQPYYGGWQNANPFENGAIDPSQLNEVPENYSQQEQTKYSNEPIEASENQSYEYEENKQHHSASKKRGKRAAGPGRRHSFSSESGDHNSRHADAEVERDLGEPEKKSLVRPNKARAGEKPQTSTDCPWVRVNNTTRGKTTRTSKINHYIPHYDFCPLPLGNWKTPRYSFKYTAGGEFQDKTMSARQIEDYIMNYPTGQVKDAKLTLWIQKCPADSARRYVSQSHSKCRFRDCPVQLHSTGTILHGHYRVAFDESYGAYGDQANPFLVSGYAHLYCMERFLNFEAVCQKADVRVDTRTIAKEPKGKSPFSLTNEPGLGAAQQFLTACKENNLREIFEFQNYPDHSKYQHGDPKPHEDTLIYHMTKIKMENRAPAQMKQFKERQLRATQLIINMGDLDMWARERIREKHNKAKKKRKNKGRKNAKEGDGSASELSPDEDIKRRVAQIQAELPSDSEESKPKSTRSRKRKRGHLKNIEEEEAHHNWEKDDDESESEYVRQKQVGFSPGTRKSPRKRSRINYDEAEQPNPLITHAAQEPLFNTNDASNVRNDSVASILSLSNTDQLVSFEDLVLSDSNMNIITDDAAFQKLFESTLERRRSSTMSQGPGIQKRLRQASFNDCPVSSSKKYNSNDPPNQLSTETYSPLPSPRRVDPYKRTRAASKVTQRS